MHFQQFQHLLPSPADVSSIPMRCARDDSISDAACVVGKPSVIPFRSVSSSRVNAVAKFPPGDD